MEGNLHGIISTAPMILIKVISFFSRPLSTYFKEIFQNDHFNRLVGNDDFFLHKREDVEVKNPEENNTAGSSRKRRDYQSINDNKYYVKNLQMRFNSSISNCWNGACGLLISRVCNNVAESYRNLALQINPHILEQGRNGCSYYHLCARQTTI